MDDNRLMALLAAGDHDALEELIRRHRAAALRQAESILRDAALAEDVVQEAFARVYLLRHRYRPDFAFTTYMGVMVRNLCIDQLRRRKKQPVPLQELPEGATASAEEEFLAGEGRMRLWSTLQSLDARDRALLTGYALDGLSYRELAQQLRLSIPQVKIRLHRIRKRLRSKESDDQ